MTGGRRGLPWKQLGHHQTENALDSQSLNGLALLLRTTSFSRYAEGDSHDPDLICASSHCLVGFRASHELAGQMVSS